MDLAGTLLAGYAALLVLSLLLVWAAYRASLRAERQRAQALKSPPEWSAVRPLARPAPRLRERRRRGRFRRSGEPVLERALDARVEGVQPVERQRLG